MKKYKKYFLLIEGVIILVNKQLASQYVIQREDKCSYSTHFTLWVFECLVTFLCHL